MLGHSVVTMICQWERHSLRVYLLNGKVPRTFDIVHISITYSTVFSNVREKPINRIQAK